jgi:GxxExxY protein
MNTDTKPELIEKDLTDKIIGACMEVSNELGTGFLESVYEKALVIALTARGLKVQAQAPLEVRFRGHLVGEFYADILVEGRVVVEVKAAKALNAEHEAQLINYLRATGIKVGLLVNFGRPRVEWKRLVW